jgi:hypothetical protein
MGVARQQRAGHPDKMTLGVLCKYIRQRAAQRGYLAGREEEYWRRSEFSAPLSSHPCTDRATFHLDGYERSANSVVCRR